MKYLAFIKALGIPDGDKARLLYEAAVESGIKTSAQAKRIFVETRQEDMARQVAELVAKTREEHPKARFEIVNEED